MAKQISTRVKLNDDVKHKRVSFSIYPNGRIAVEMECPRDFIFSGADLRKLRGAITHAYYHDFKYEMKKESQNGNAGRTGTKVERTRIKTGIDDGKVEGKGRNPREGNKPDSDAS